MQAVVVDQYLAFDAAAAGPHAIENPEPVTSAWANKGVDAVEREVDGVAHEDAGCDAWQVLLRRLCVLRFELGDQGGAIRPIVLVADADADAEAWALVSVDGATASAVHSAVIPVCALNSHVTSICPSPPSNGKQMLGDVSKYVYTPDGSSFEPKQPRL